eukprot:5108970-Pyramimonas_sp.AAC.1
MVFGIEQVVDYELILIPRKPEQRVDDFSLVESFYDADEWYSVTKGRTAARESVAKKMRLARSPRTAA